MRHHLCIVSAKMTVTESKKVFMRVWVMLLFHRWFLIYADIDLCLIVQLDLF